MKKYNIVICGGGSTYTLPMVKTLLDNTEKFPISNITLFDTDESKQQKIYQAAQVMAAPIGVDIAQSYQLDETFSGADFVFMQIRSGGLEMRELDEKIPLAHDCVGQETCGAGGFAYGMRSVVDVVDIVKAVRGQAPEAWIINYSNPAAIVAEATNRVFPNDRKIINLCDMPIAILDGFAEALGTERQKLTPRYFGLNHFGWFTHLYDEQGNDLLPGIKQRLTEGNMMPEELKEDSDWVKTFEQLSKMATDLKGHIPNTYLQYYLYPEYIVSKSDKNYTRANAVMDNRLQAVQDQCDFIIENNTIEGSGLERGVHGTYIVELATALAMNEKKEFIMIVPNTGIIPNFSYGAMVEVPCVVSKNGAEPIHVGEIDTFYKGLMESQYAYEKLTVDAILNRDYDAALKALTLNRTVVNVDTGKSILDAFNTQMQFNLK